MYLYGRPVGARPHASRTRVGASFNAGTLPAVGDVSGYVTKGNDLLNTAKDAAQGNTTASANLLADGVTVVSALAPQGSPVATIAVDIGGGVVAGFLTGGPVGAVIGAAGGALSAISSLSGGGSNVGSIALDAGGHAIQAHLLSWKTANPDDVINPATNGPNPPGWALADYCLQVTGRPILPNGQKGANAATPFWWALPLDGFGINRWGSFTLDGDVPVNHDAYLNHALRSILPLPGKSREDSLAHAASRAPPARMTIEPSMSPLFDKNAAAMGLIIPLPDKADAFLGIGTAYAMLNQGALARSIVSELLVQLAIYQEAEPGHMPSPEFAALVDYYIGMAATEPPPPAPPTTLNFGAMGGLLGRLHTLPPVAIKFNPALLGSLHVMPAGLTATPRQQWVAHYLALTPGSG
jgi:hypothetical protein